MQISSTDTAIAVGLSPFLDPSPKQSQSYNSPVQLTTAVVPGVVERSVNRAADARYISIDAGWKPTRRLYLSLDYSTLRYEGTSADQETQWNSRLNARYNFARDLSLRTEIELNSEEQGFANFLFRWKYR